MKCKDIFKSALRMLNEKGAEDEQGDYAERAPYILAAMFSEAARTDKLYRAAHGLGEGSEQHGLTGTGNILQQHMAAAEEADDDLMDHFLLAHDDAAAVVGDLLGIGLKFLGIHGRSS